MIRRRKRMNSPTFVPQEDEEQAAEDAGEAAVKPNKQRRHGAIRLAAVTAGISWHKNKSHMKLFLYVPLMSEKGQRSYLLDHFPPLPGTPDAG